MLITEFDYPQKVLDIPVAYYEYLHPISSIWSAVQLPISGSKPFNGAGFVFGFWNKIFWINFAIAGIGVF